MLGKPQNSFQHQLFIRLEIIIFRCNYESHGMDGFILCWHSGERKTACRSPTARATSTQKIFYLIKHKPHYSVGKFEPPQPHQRQMIGCNKNKSNITLAKPSKKKTKVAETLRNSWVFERYSPPRRRRFKIQYRSTNTNLERKSGNRRTLKNTRKVHRYIIWRSLSKVNRQGLHYQKKFQILGFKINGCTKIITHSTGIEFWEIWEHEWSSAFINTNLQRKIERLRAQQNLT